MKETYIALMEKSLSAYSDEHIARYFAEVKQNGLTEHGFPRLTANIGILIAHGRRRDLLPIFSEMMEFCCKTIPTVDAANDFSVREIVCCLEEVAKNGVVSAEDAARWRSYLAMIEPTTCYHTVAKDPADDVRNWALFTALSEYFRLQAGIGGSMDFIELQLASQLKYFDENGMYRDNKRADIHQPIMYDLVPRGLFALLLDQGYRGAHYDAIDAHLKKAGLLTLTMQSANGEMAFGGRSNQFLLNEAWMIAVYEFEAKRYAREGDLTLAATFKAASKRALAVTEAWLAKEPIRHIKNRFPTETKYGCEKYAYFDKYMITTASNLYAAYLLCDDSIPTQAIADHAPTAWQTTEYFHKVFLKSGGYALEFDTNADPDYDASGLGRIHREGAPSTICLSVPCPAAPRYTTDMEEPMALSLCPAVHKNGEWHFATDAQTRHELLGLSQDESSPSASFACRFLDGECVRTDYAVSADGVRIAVRGMGELGYLLPAFCFDGETAPQISADEHSLTVSYEGWLCRYTTDGTLTDTGRHAANRNGHYRAFLVKAKDVLNVKVEIVKQK